MNKLDENKERFMKEIGIRKLDPKYKFYKVYGTVPMFYSKEYLENHTIEEMKAKDIESISYFNQCSLYDEIKP